MNFSGEKLSQAAETGDRLPLRIGALRVCPHTGTVLASGSVQKLRRKELDLIRYLYTNAGRTVTRTELLSEVWKCSEQMMTRTVDQTMSSLRRKIGDDPENPRHLRTVYGVGYTLGSVNS